MMITESFYILLRMNQLFCLLQKFAGNRFLKVLLINICYVIEVVLLHRFFPTEGGNIVWEDNFLKFANRTVKDFCNVWQFFLKILNDWGKYAVRYGDDV